MRSLLVILAAAVALATAAAAAAATAPSATTGPVSTVGPTSATVTGTVNPNGTATSWYVEYGTSTTYGSRTSSVSAGSGTSSVAVSGTLSGLKAGTTYHYRIVATSTAGTAHGADGILTTSSAPAAVTGDATSVTATSATLTGSVDPNSRSTTWYFEYGTSTGYGSKTPARDAGAGTSSVSVSMQVTGLHTGRRYHFRLVATSDAGTAHGSDHTFVPATGPSPTTKPANAVSDTAARLEGTVAGNGLATTVHFDYGTSASYGHRTPDKSVGSGTTNVSQTLSGLAPNTTYHFRLVASNGAGTAAGSDLTFTTTGAPVARTGTATAGTSSGATLTGTVDPNGHGTSWYFEWGRTTAYGTRSATRSAGSGTTVITVSTPITGLDAGTLYHFRLVAANGVGTSYGGDVTFSTAGPPITLAPSQGVVIAGNPVRLSGRIATGQSNVSVAVYAERYGGTAFVALATVLTNAGGTWTLTVHPRIATAYKALFNGSPSAVRSVGVRPAISIHAVPRHAGRFRTHVSGVRSFAGRIVQLQRRRVDGRWVTVSRARLNRYSSTVFAPRLARGRWTLRVAMSVNQAGAGYLAGFSRVIAYRKR